MKPIIVSHLMVKIQNFHNSGDSGKSPFDLPGNSRQDINHGHKIVR
jgi:hypothetical protein